MPQQRREAGRIDNGLNASGYGSYSENDAYGSEYAHDIEVVHHVDWWVNFRRC